MKKKLARMKNIGLVVFLLLVISCDKDEIELNKEYVFISEYKTTITVGGFIGIMERIFEIGEVYEGIEERDETIKIRIADHSSLNENCPNSHCYQEFLNVPKEFLVLVEK